MPRTSVGDRRGGGCGGKEEQVWPCMEDNEQKTRGVEARRSEGSVASCELIRPAVELLRFVILTAQTFPGSPDGLQRQATPTRLTACLPALHQ